MLKVQMKKSCSDWSTEGVLNKRDLVEMPVI